MPEIDPTLILLDRAQRQRSDVSDTAELEESIARRGLIQPIVLRRDGEALRLVAGERRLRSCINLGWHTVPYVLLENLSPIDAEVVELEENIKREDLPWQDRVRAIARIHALKVAEYSGAWTQYLTARAIGLDQTTVSRSLRLVAAFSDPRIRDASGYDQAVGALQRITERRTAEVVGDIISRSAVLFTPPQASTRPSNGNPQDDSSISADCSPIGLVSLDRPSSESPQQHPSAPAAILNLDFIEWSATYSGPKFSLVHVDFPYGTLVHGDKRSSEYDSSVELYDALVASFCANLDNFTSYSAHILFWFSMTTYEATRRKLESCGLRVYPYPLVWFVTDRGFAPVVGQTLRRTYHTAFLCTRGDRPLVRIGVNDAYAGPAVAKPIHPTQKSEAMLRHFLSALVDGTTNVLDPTCGSAGALVAAEDLGAKSVLGLELDGSYAAAANAHLAERRMLRQATGGPPAP